MARNYTQPGNVLSYTAGVGEQYSAGDVVVMGDTVGIALVDIGEGETGSVAIEGVFEVPKVSGTAWSVGQKIDWDASASAFTVGATPAEGDVIGCAIVAAPAGSTETTGYAKLTPGTGAFEAGS